MLQINNQTPFQAEIHPIIDPQGHDFLVVVIKASYLLQPNNNQLNLADEQVTIQHNDEYYLEAGESSIKLPSDLAPSKSVTDVILIGHAYSPESRAVNQCDVTLSVGDRQHILRIYGDRVWQKNVMSWSISEPESFKKMPLQFENAYGGVDQSLGKQVETLDYDIFNPFGKGYYSPKGKAYSGLSLPNIENPRSLITDIKDRPKPVGFGAISRDWQPRLGLAGTYDKEWQKNRMPLLPTDFNPAFFHTAHPDLQFSPFLTGTEFVTMTNVDESGHLSFKLPGEKLSVKALIRGQQESLIPQLDTLIIQPDEHLVSITWRCAIPCVGKLLYVKSINIERESSNAKG